MGLDIRLFWIRRVVFSMSKKSPHFKVIFESSKVISTLLKSVFCRIRVSFESSKVRVLEKKKGSIFLRKSQWKGVSLYFEER